MKTAPGSMRAKHIGFLSIALVTLSPLTIAFGSYVYHTAYANFEYWYHGTVCGRHPDERTGEVLFHPRNCESLYFPRAGGGGDAPLPRDTPRGFALITIGVRSAHSEPACGMLEFFGGYIGATDDDTCLTSDGDTLTIPVSANGFNGFGLRWIHVSGPGHGVWLSAHFVVDDFADQGDRM